MKSTIIIFMILISFFANSYSQDTLWLLNGKKIDIKDSKTDSTGFLHYKKMNGSLKKIEIDEVFSIKKQDKTEIVFYKPDSVNDLTIQQMRDYVQGEFDAQKSFKDKFLIKTMPAVVGFTSSLVMPIVGLTFLVPVPPGGYCLYLGGRPIKKELMQIPEQYKDNKYYMTGYTIAAKKKRISNSLITTGIGIIVGLTTAMIIYEKK